MGKQIPFHLPSSIFENKWTKEIHTKEIELPSVKDTEGVLEGVTEGYRRAPKSAPTNWGVGWEVEPQSGVGLG